MKGVFSVSVKESNKKSFNNASFYVVPRYYVEFHFCKVFSLVRKRFKFR